MTTIVPDASVAAKWILSADEPFRDQAMELLRRHKEQEVGFIVPDMFWAELANVLWKAVRAKRLSRAQARIGIEELLDENLPSVSSIDLLTSAFAIANNYNRSVYDSLYVALAVITNAEMVTADARLANAVAAHLPVKFIGAI